MKIEDVKFLPMKRKDYFSKKFITTPIQNFQEWRSWMQEKCCGLEAVRHYAIADKISGDNRARFKKLFGKLSFTSNGGTGHYFHGWLADLGTAQLIILTASEHGTCYEVVVYRDGYKIKNDIPRVIEFLDMIANSPT